MNSTMTTNSQLSTNEPKKNIKQLWKQILSKQLKQEQKQRNGYSMEGFQWGVGGKQCRGKVQGRRSIIGRHKIDGERLRMV